MFALALAPSGRAQTTDFTYQGQLIDNNSPANGSYDMVFYLRDAATGGNPVSITNIFDGDPGHLPPVAVDSGLFTVTLAFGSAPFTGQRLWLQVETRPHGAGAYSVLTPRTELTPTPYAIYAQTAGGVANNSVGNAQLASDAVGTQLRGVFVDILYAVHPLVRPRGKIRRSLRTFMILAEEVIVALVVTLYRRWMRPQG